MFKEHYHIIGVMSGTSLDGIDLAELHFSIINGKWRFEIQKAETIVYPPYWLNKLKKALTFSEKELENLNIEYTQFLGKTINLFIQNNQLSALDAVCSHGHTILHQPQKGVTLQIGNLPKLAKIIHQKVVCDFRKQDVNLGGQGAPLVPIGDKILFSDFDFCLNLGGFSNVSLEEKGKRIAFDISPVNTVLNFYANQLGFEYDNQGKIARSGSLNLALFEELNQLTYYQEKPPKSLGMEFVNETILPLIEKHAITIAAKLHTFVEHIAFQIALALAEQNGKMLITGGGAYHEFLINRIQFYLPNLEIIIPDKKTLEFKEALIFGLLGVLKMRNEINVLSSVTGAKQNHSSGIIFN